MTIPQNVQINKPLGKNSISSLYVLFEDRSYYHDFIIPAIIQNFGFVPFGDLTKNNSLYGLVDEQLNVITPDSSFLKLIPSADNKDKLVMDFVADAFIEMNNYLASAVVIGKLSKNSPYFNLKSHRSYINPATVVNESQIRILSKFNTYANSNKSLYSSIIDEESFNKKYIDYIKNQIKNNFVITKSGIVLSTNFFNFVSGLVIDIAKDKADNDTIKYDKYLNVNDFDCFRDACKRFGFKIDVNVPWRIYADLNSPAMKEKSGNHIGYMQRYNLGGITDLFSKRYLVAYAEEIEHLKNYFYNSYSDFMKNNLYYELDYNKLQSCDFRKSVVRKRDLITREQYYQKFPDTYWLRLYTYFRNYETKRGLTQQQFENVVREANNYVKAGRNFPALTYVNDYFKQFKDVQYLSSLQANNKVVEQRVQSAFVSDLIF
jgi:hypothetical protein